MGTPVDERKETTFKVVMENGAPVTRQIVALLDKSVFGAAGVVGEAGAADKDSARYLLQLDRDIHIEDTNWVYTACFYASREEEMLKGVTFPVTVELGLDGKKLRPNRIISDTPPEPTFTIGQQIITTADIPIGENSKAPAGERGTVVEIVTSADPNCGRIIGAWLPNWGKVSAASTSFKVDADIEGTDKDAPMVDIAAYDKRIQDMAELNVKLIRELHDETDRAQLWMERALAVEKEAQEHTAPLPTIGKQYEQVFIADISAAELQRGYDEKWDFVHYHVSETPKSLSVVVIRPKPTNGTPKPEKDVEVVAPTPPVEATEVQEAAVVMNADAEQQTVATEAAVKDMTEVYKPGKVKPSVGLWYQGEFKPTSGVKIRGGK